MKHPVLTIAIPTYNGASTIGQTLESVVSQLTDGVDILVSDNASTDETPEIVAKFAERYPQISYRRNSENVGPDRNFDAAIVGSAGIFVWLFSDDDIMEPTAIGTLLPVLAANPSLGALFVNYAVYLPTGECLDPSAIAISGNTFYDSGERFLEAVSIGPIFCSSNVVRRELWQSADRERYFGTGWVHYGAMLSVLRDSTAYSIGAPQVRLISRAGWDTHGALFKHTVALGKIINSLGPLGYSSDVLRRVLAKIARPLPITAISAKRAGMSFSGRLVADTTREFFRSFPMHTFATWCVLLIPNFAYTFAFWAYGRMRRTTAATRALS